MENIKLRRERFQLQSTDKGMITWLMGLWYVIFFCAILICCLQIFAVAAASRAVEDALSASNLAACLIDVREYGTTGRLVVEGSEETFGRYENALRQNLNLNENDYANNQQLLSGFVRTEEFIVYNVWNGEVEIWKMDKNGLVSTDNSSIGNCMAPNGRTITSTGIYSEVSFSIKGVLGWSIQGRKGKLVDLVAEY